MRQIEIKFDNRSYNIYLGNDILKNSREFFGGQAKVMIISDNGVPKKYIDTVSNQFENSYVHIFSSGEKNKTIETYQEIISDLIRYNFSRSDTIIAIGGGLVSDVAGFVASSYMRGIKFYIISTTLLSAVDASIGGKTAINFNGIKNVVGAFYQPNGIIIDLETFDTLPERIFHEGFGEIIKIALTSDKHLFEMLEQDYPLEDIVYQAILNKKKIVEIDEKETNLRRILNFGHTVGHSLEALYQGEYYHGECVTMGMMYFLNDNLKIRVQKLLDKYQLPYKNNKQIDEIISYIKLDKKNDQEGIYIVEVNKIGNGQIGKINYEELYEILDRGNRYVK